MYDNILPYRITLEGIKRLEVVHGQSLNRIIQLRLSSKAAKICIQKVVSFSIFCVFVSSDYMVWCDNCNHWYRQVYYCTGSEWIGNSICHSTWSVVLHASCARAPQNLAGLHFSHWFSWRAQASIRHQARENTLRLALHWRNFPRATVLVKRSSHGQKLQGDDVW